MPVRGLLDTAYTKRAEAYMNYLEAALAAKDKEIAQLQHRLFEMCTLVHKISAISYGLRICLEASPTPGRNAMILFCEISILSGIF